MPVYALADFGSTFTKVSLVEGGSGRLLATAQHPTTIDTDVVDGYRCAEADALRQAGLQAADRALAASSAAGGLRMVAVGLVDDLTAAAAKRSALGAGAKVAAVHSGALDDDQVARIRDDRPDVILFAGGTDGGERARVVANAERVAALDLDVAVVVACNREAAPDAAAHFEASGHETVVVDNLLPDIHREHSGPARAAIRELFISRVVRAKGLSSTSSFFRSVLMPTPSAVLECAELLARGSAAAEGLGAVAVLDVGGATTDVHSVVPPQRGHERIARAGPAPNAAARTVEGDLGMRWSAGSVLDLDRAWLSERLGAAAAGLSGAVAERVSHPAFVPATEAERDVDRALATSCMTLALGRHVGRASTRYVVGEGAEVVIEGRDLREVSTVVVTGGALTHDPEAASATARGALARMEDGQPAPRAAQVIVDERYIAAAAGLLATEDPSAALRLLQAELLGS